MECFGKRNEVRFDPYCVFLLRQDSGFDFFEGEIAALTVVAERLLFLLFAVVVLAEARIRHIALQQLLLNALVQRQSGTLYVRPKLSFLPHRLIGDSSHPF